MALLNYDAEMRPTSAVMPHGAHARAEGKSLRLAEQLVESWFESDFDFSQYKDNYYEKLKQLIETKLEGEEIDEPEEEEAEPEVINLMDALRKSVAQHVPKKSSTRKPRRKRRAS
jgi:DNA end-binding protein Ku